MEVGESKSGPPPSDGFPYFAQLPAELRLEIWRMCLPDRVNEIDFPTSDCAREHRPCFLRASTFYNQCPPVITRVCVESRRVAYEQGAFGDEDPRLDPPYISDWEEHIATGVTWEDATRTSSTHLNWQGGCDDEYGIGSDGYEGPLEYLHRCANRINSPASFTAVYLSGEFRGYGGFWPELVDVLNLRSRWDVIMDVIVIHAPTAGTVAASGLFGLLGDAPVQIVAVSEFDKLYALYDFADKCEFGSVRKRAQHIFRRSAIEWRLKLREMVAENGEHHDAKLSSKLCPAIMFRWCTHMCNHADPRLPPDGMMLSEDN